MCGNRIDRDEAPFTVRAGGVLKEYPICRQHKRSFDKLAAKFFGQLDSFIASDSDIFGTEDVGPHSEEAHASVGVSRPQAEVRRRARQLIAEIVIDDRAFRYPVVLMELDRLGYTPPRGRLRKQDIQEFRRMYEEGLIDKTLSTPVNN